MRCAVLILLIFCGSAFGQVAFTQSDLPFYRGYKVYDSYTNYDGRVIGGDPDLVAWFRFNECYTNVSYTNSSLIWLAGYSNSAAVYTNGFWDITVLVTNYQDIQRFTKCPKLELGWRDILYYQTNYIYDITELNTVPVSSGSDTVTYYETILASFTNHYGNFSTNFPSKVTMSVISPSGSYGLYKMNNTAFSNKFTFYWVGPTKIFSTPAPTNIAVAYMVWPVYNTALTNWCEPGPSGNSALKLEAGTYAAAGYADLSMGNEHTEPNSDFTWAANYWNVKEGRGTLAFWLKIELTDPSVFISTTHTLLSEYSLGEPEPTYAVCSSSPIFSVFLNHGKMWFGAMQNTGTFPFWAESITDSSSYTNRYGEVVAGNILTNMFGQWHHYAITWAPSSPFGLYGSTPSTIKFYIDGLPVNPRPSEQLNCCDSAENGYFSQNGFPYGFEFRHIAPAYGAALYPGWKYNHSSNLFVVGQPPTEYGDAIVTSFDDLRFYSRPLGDKEIQTGLYSGGAR